MYTNNRGAFKVIVSMALVIATLLSMSILPAEAATTSTAARIYSDFTTSPAYKNYSEFASQYIAKYSMPIPGLAHTDVNGTDCTTMVPQGICFAKDYMIVSAYDSSGSCKSVLYIISNQDSKNRAYLMTLVLPISGHVGGVAFDGTYLWISNGKNASSIKYTSLVSTVNSAVAGNKKSTSISFYSTCAVSTQASFMTYSDGMLWVGEFKDKGDSTGKMYSYVISSDAKKLTKKYYITLPDRIQGACFKDGYLILSRSYNRNVSGSSYISQLRIYKYSQPDSNGNLKKNSVVKVVDMPPMLEGVVAGSSYMYMLFESAATKYYTGSDGNGKCKYPTDRIVAFKFANLLDFGTTEDTTTPSEPETPTEPDTPVDPEPETPTEPDTPTDPEPDTPTDPEPDTPTDPEPDTPTDPEPDTPTDPEPDTPTDPEPDTPTDPEPDTPTEPEVDDGKVYFPTCGSNIGTFADALVAMGYDSSKATRKLIAAANGIESYTGTASENATLLALMCEGKLVNPGIDPSVDDVATLFLDTSTANLVLGKSLQISALFGQGSVTWKTSNPNVATVSSLDSHTVSIKSVGVGKATITCTLSNGNFAKCVVFVEADYFAACDAEETSWVNAFERQGFTSTLEARSSIAFYNGITGYSGTAEEDAQLLQLMKAGLLINPGLSQVASETTKVGLNTSSASANIGQKIQLIASFLEGSVTWKTSNPNVATITVMDSDTAWVEAVGVGKVTITCLLSNGNFSKCVLYVSEGEGSPEITPSAIYYPKCADTYESIALALESIGVDSSKDYRTKIAVANGIDNYTGTAEQNIQMLDLLKAGKLIRPDITLQDGQYVVTFNANGGSGTMGEFIMTQSASLPANGYTLKGYSFQGWSTTADGAVEYADGAMVNFTEHTVLYAVWKPNTYTLRFDANGGSGTMSDLTVTYGVSCSLPTPGFTKTDYEVVGWYRYRTSDNKWYYKSEDGATTAWYVEGTEPAGYEKIVLNTTSNVSKTSAVDGDVVILYAVWQEGGNYTSLDGKTVMFIGNSFVYYGGVVEHGGQKKTDQGWFYEICKSNGENVTVYDCTYGSHHLYDFTTSGCKSGSCHNGKDLLSGVNLKSVDYLFISESGNNNSNFIKDVKNVVKRFPSSTKVFYLAHSYTYIKNHTKITGKFSELEKMGISVIEWGKLVEDVIDGKTSVPGATVKYNKKTFIKNKGDTYHPNPLAGYITAQMAYCAVTGKSAVGQLPDVYSIGDTLKYGSSVVGYSKYISKHYSSSSASNFKTVLKSKDDILGLQKLMDKYLAKRGLGIDG